MYYRGKKHLEDGFWKVVVGVGFEPTNARSGRIYSPHPLATWIPYQPQKIRNYHIQVRWQDDCK